MKDKSKILTVINTGKRKVESEQAVQQIIRGGSGSGSPGGAYLLKSIWDKCWELRKTDQGEEYIFGKLPVAVQYDLTSYVDVGNLKLPDIYDGLRIDNQTLYWEETTEETTDEEGNAITNVELSSDNTGLVYTKGLEFAEKKYLDDNFYNRTWIDEHYVTLDTSQTISGEKNFTGGLLVKGNEIVWDERGFWKLDGDLLITGGFASFADNPKYTPSTVMDALVLDNQTLDINEYGQLFVKNGGGANVEIVESLPSDEYKENTLYVVVQ